MTGDARSEAERLRRSWVANAAAWCEAVRERRIESRRNVTDAAIVAAVLERKPRRVLDVGCGEGWLARALSARGIDVTGIDASVPLIDAARALGGARFLAMGYENIASLGGEEFDVIVANFSILDDRAEELLGALAPLLARDGVLIVQTVHPSSVPDAQVEGWRTETFAAIPAAWAEPMPWFFRTMDSWRRVFAGAGFTIVETREPASASVVFVCRRAKGGVSRCDTIPQ